MRRHRQGAVERSSPTPRGLWLAAVPEGKDEAHAQTTQSDPHRRQLYFAAAVSRCGVPNTGDASLKAPGRGRCAEACQTSEQVTATASHQNWCLGPVHSKGKATTAESFLGLNQPHIDLQLERSQDTKATSDVSLPSQHSCAALSPGYSQILCEVEPFMKRMKPRVGQYLAIQVAKRRHFPAHDAHSRICHPLCSCEHG